MTGIILLIVLGILLFVIEFMLVPGITIAGVGGLVLTVLGVYKAFEDYGVETGIWVLLGTILLSILVIAFSLRPKTWRRFMLNTNVEGNVDSDYIEETFKAGDTAETVTRLNPIGKIMINDMVREAKSIDGYIDSHTKVEIVEVESKHITVKPIKK